MQDDELIALYFSRSETAIAETKQQYGTYCYSIAYHILSHPEDAEECENDTYWKAWNAIPPTRPRQLEILLGKITRNIALHVWEHQHAENGRNNNGACSGRTFGMYTIRGRCGAGCRGV